MTAAADRKAAREADEAAAAAPAESPAPDAPADAVEAPTGERRTYRATRAMAGVSYGREFVATQDDPRVLSGYATDLGPAGAPAAPAEVQEALDGKGAVADPA